MKKIGKIVNVKLEDIREETNGLYLGVEPNTIKDVVIFKYPRTDEVEARAYEDRMTNNFFGNYELIDLNESQRRYATDLLKLNSIWI
ncbi:MAG: hypothetical protein AABW50_00260 [Nanoarchaeota archaeon]